MDDKNDIRQDMLNSIEDMLGYFKFKTTFAPASLIRLEGVINEHFPKFRKAPYMPTTYIPFGFYLGEVIVRNVLKTKWFLSPNIFDSYIEVTHDRNEEIKARMMPFNRVAKFFEDRDYGLKLFYDLARDKRMMDQMLDEAEKTKADTSDWKHKDNLLYRVHKVENPKK